MTDSRAVTVKIAVATVDMTGRADDKFAGTTENLLRCFLITGSWVPESTVKGVLVLPQKLLGAEIDAEWITVQAGSGYISRVFRMFNPPDADTLAPATRVM